MAKPKLQVTNEFEILVVTDGTETFAQVETPHGALGVGKAKRRKGDERNSHIGKILALKRAFEDAAGWCERELKAWGYDD